jgi:preprotein translocase subunit SecY
MKIEWNKVTWYSWLATAIAALMFIWLLVYLRSVHVAISMSIKQTIDANLERNRLPLHIVPRGRQPGS